MRRRSKRTKVVALLILVASSTCEQWAFHNDRMCTHSSLIHSPTDIKAFPLANDIEPWSDAIATQQPIQGQTLEWTDGPAYCCLRNKSPSAELITHPSFAYVIASILQTALWQALHWEIAIILETRHIQVVQL